MKTHIRDVKPLLGAKLETIKSWKGSGIEGNYETGIRARTTDAPQNHWVGPAGDPDDACICTPEAIKLIWSYHREIVLDRPIPQAGRPLRLLSQASLCKWHIENSLLSLSIARQGLVTTLILSEGRGAE